MNHGEIRYGNSYNPYPYGNPSNNASTASVSSLASTSSKILSLFKSKDKPPPVPEKDYPYASGRNALPSSSSLSLSMTLSDAGTTASSHSGTTNGDGKRSGSIFKLGRKSKKNKGKESQAVSVIGNPQNVKHEMHVDDGLNGFPPEWRSSLLQLGYTPEEIEEMILKKRQKPSLNNLSQTSTGSIGPNHAPKPSTSSSAYRYPSPPPQPQSRHQAQPSTSTQHSIPTYHTLKLQTDFAPVEGNPRLHSSNSNSPAAFASSLRSIPNRSDSPSGSISSNKQSHGGSDHRASPVPSVHRDREAAAAATPSNLSRESPITVSPRIIEAITIGTPPKPTPPRPTPTPAKPSRAPPPILFSDTLKANTYKPPVAIAVQDDDSDEEPLRPSKVNITPQKEEEKPPVQDEPSTGSSKARSAALDITPTKSITPISSKTNPIPPPPADSTSSIVTSGELTPTPDIKATPVSLTPSGIPRISLSLGKVDAGSRVSVDWSESLFSALPSATAFDGFRSSITPKGSPSSSMASKRFSRIISTPVDVETSSVSTPPSSNAATAVALSPHSIHSRTATPPVSSGPSPVSAGLSPVSVGSSPVSSGLSPASSGLSPASSGPSSQPSGPSPGPPKLELANNLSPFNTPFSASRSPQSVSGVSPQSHSSLSPNSPGSTDTSASRSSPPISRAHHVDDLPPRVSLGPGISSGDLFSFSGPGPQGRDENESRTSYRDSIASFTSYGDDAHENDRSIRESVSSYGGMEEEYIEPVVVSKATAVRLARVPSVSFQRRVDMMNTSRSADTPDLQKGFAGQGSPQVVMVQSRGVVLTGLSSAPPFTPFTVPGVESTPFSAPSSRTMHGYSSEEHGDYGDGNDYEDPDHSDGSDDDEEDEDEEDEEDPDSRYTIRVDSVKADRLMAAIMQSKGEIDLNDINKLASVTTSDSQDTVQEKPMITPTSLLDENGPESYANSRPISTASIATIKPDDDSDEEELQSPPSAKGQPAIEISSHGEEAATIDEEDEDSSALDEWLEANEVDEQSVDEAEDDHLSGNRDDGSDYDDADRPLSTNESSSLPQIDYLSPVPPASSHSLSPVVGSPRPGDETSSLYSPGALSPGSNSTDAEQSYDADTSDRGTLTPNTASTNTTNGAIDALLYLNSPGTVSSGQESVASASPQWSPIPALHLKHRRESQVFIGNQAQHNTAPGTSSAGKAGIGKRASVRSSMIYAPLTQMVLEQSLKAPPTVPTDSELEVSPATQDKVQKSSLLSKRSPSKYPDLLKPLISYINDGDPRKIFTNLEQIAEGESGDIFAANTSDPVSLSVLPTADSEGEGTLHIVAIKCVRVEDTNSSKVASLKKEAAIFSTIGSHQSILAYSGMWIADTLSSADGSGAHAQGQPSPLQELWIQMELMERSLADLIALFEEGLKLEERHVARFALDIVLGLTFLAERFVAHRDLRSDNLLVSVVDGHVKIADFAQAVQLKAGDTILEDPAGIIYWQAPEMRRGPYDALKVDVWSLGATVWELVEGETPFESDPNGPSDRLPELTDVQDVSQGLLGFLASCELPPSRRLAARELLDMPFILARCTREEILQLLSRARTMERAMIPES
ncbi:hypothetical protein FRC14_002788 [Serendipita sp. 396]|nr:hypothetical protein FRC14_002788 [Serendipita sp. 396]KAG8827350.1 hypothetical protein FRC19_003927 [Serendipita sp. 401]KAG8875121.1 hypothetical protein FRC20_004446 [Serendipita sp. 405]